MPRSVLFSASCTVTVHVGVTSSGKEASVVCVMSRPVF